MIKQVTQYREQQEREHVAFLRRLSYADAIRMTEELLSCGLLEQVQLRAEDHPIALQRLLRQHGRP